MPTAVEAWSLNHSDAGKVHPGVFKESIMWAITGGPVVRALSFCYRGTGLISGLGTKICMLRSADQKKKKKL